jgi:glycosyltransferase involved in cell wall biosynthesis
LSWSVIIFCYNEAGNLEQTARRCLHFLQQQAKSFEIIIVNDGSTDATREVCHALEQSIPELQIITHPVNMGIGMALRTGYERAKHTYVCAIPGDGQFDSRELLQVASFENDIFYSFYREKNDYNFYRKSLTLVNRVFNYVFLGIAMRDVNWIKVYRKEQLDFAQIQLNSSLIESEICAKLIKGGCKPMEIKSVYQKRVTGSPKGGSWRTLKKAASEVLDLFFTVRKFNKALNLEAAKGPGSISAGLAAPRKIEL